MLTLCSVDVRGKKVAVIGTGATGIQCSQEIGKTAESMTVFQRTPNLCLPMGQKKLTKEEQDKEKPNCKSKNNIWLESMY
jgi:cation diffusion facilitator CzcD-associated flavoprotein CzcO